MSNNVTQQLEQTAFGELLTAELTPIVQISAQYGIEEDLNIINANGGSYQLSNSLYEVSSGTNAVGVSSLNTKKQANYKPGQGLVARFSGVFDTPQASNLQAAGFITSEDSFAFGYLNTTFGIITSLGGAVEAQELTLTVAATGAENATVTIDGTGYTVPLTSGTKAHNCWEIANSLTSQVATYLFSSNGDTVYAMSKLPGPQGSFAFSSSTAVGAWVQQAAGVNPTQAVIEPSNWSHDSAEWLDPLKGNVYEIKFSYLGFSGIEFYIKDPETNDKILVHVYEYGNTSTTPIVRNPTFRCGWVTQNFGNTTNVTVKGASALIAIEGKSVSDNTPRGIEGSLTAVGTTQTNLMTVRNRFHFGDIINRASIIPLLLSFGTDSAKGAFVRVTAGATFGGDLNFSYLDKTNSIIETATDAVTVSGGRFIASFLVTSAGLVISSDNFRTRIEPDEIITISAAVTKTPSADVFGSASLLEEV